MLLEDFHYHLPQELIAQQPAARRTDARLLHLRLRRGRPEMSHLRFGQLPGLLRAGDVLVLNDTRVVPARLQGHKESGGQVELLLERLLPGGRREGKLWRQPLLALLRCSRRPAESSRISLPGNATAMVTGRAGGFYRLELLSELAAEEYFERHGQVPLPPYIHRADEDDLRRQDRERYQTVYARRPGAVAAPTAGLHFTRELLDKIEGRGIGLEWLTLHVGAGTFLPVRSANIAEHHMHRERFFVPESLPARLRQVRARGGRVVAVGTTVVRALETAWQRQPPLVGWQESGLFIRPGYRFQVVDALVTNFHLPRSTLLMLVCALAGHRAVMNAYAEAVRRRYRFFSYGDAMFIEPEVTS